MNERIGLFGGCFNPVHCGHLAVARAALAELLLDKVLFIPSGEPPLKGASGLLPGAERLAMINLAVAAEPMMEACDIEIARPGLSFTVDTVRALQLTLPAGTELVFILGSDCLDRLPRWKGIEELHERLRFAVVQRPGAEQHLNDPRLVALPCAASSISSTEVRGRLRCGLDAGALVPSPVASYLMSRGHYAGTAGDLS